MIGIPFVQFVLNLILAGALIRTFEFTFHDSANPLGSVARALAVVY